MRFFSKKVQKMVGLDLSASTVKLLELGKKGDTYFVESYAVEPLPPEAMNETHINDIERVGFAIANAVKRSATRVKFGAIAIQNSAVITKIIQMTADLKEHELMAQIFSEADRYIPYPLEEVNLDFKILGAHPKNSELMDVLLVGTKTENVEARIEALSLGGLRAKVVDVETYVIERAFSLIREDLPSVVAILEVAEHSATLCVLHEGKSIYMRAQDFGAKHLLEDSQYLARALQFFFSSNGFTQIEAIVLAGSFATMPQLAQHIQTQSGILTSIVNPFSKMQIAPDIDIKKFQEEAPGLLQCCGLAMRAFMYD
jgi:type IV pilus assembly protein PilM